MGLQTVTISKSSRRNAPPQVNAAAEEFFPHAHVAILDDDLLEDEYFEPDGVNDFVRDFESWDPDREF